MLVSGGGSRLVVERNLLFSGITPRHVQLFNAFPHPAVLLSKASHFF